MSNAATIGRMKSTRSLSRLLLLLLLVTCLAGARRKSLHHCQPPPATSTTTQASSHASAKSDMEDLCRELPRTKPRPRSSSSPSTPPKANPSKPSPTSSSPNGRSAKRRPTAASFMLFAIKDRKRWIEIRLRPRRHPERRQSRRHRPLHGSRAPCRQLRRSRNANWPPPNHSNHRHRRRT